MLQQMRVLASVPQMIALAFHSDMLWAWLSLGVVHRQLAYVANVLRHALDIARILG